MGQHPRIAAAHTSGEGPPWTVDGIATIVENPVDNLLRTRRAAAPQPIMAYLRKLRCQTLFNDVAAESLVPTASDNVGRGPVAVGRPAARHHPILSIGSKAAGGMMVNTLPAAREAAAADDDGSARAPCIQSRNPQRSVSFPAGAWLGTAGRRGNH